jgi:hypothetical protein
MKITEQIAKKAKATYVCNYVGFVMFEHEGKKFSMSTRKGIKDARKKLMSHPEKIQFHE